MKKRLFLAIDFPPHIKKQIGQALEELRKKYPEIRWEMEESLHITLKFLGWVETEMANSKWQIANGQSKLDKITAGMEKAVGGIKPFWLRPTKVGHFLRESLIVWLGIESQEGLFKLVENLEREMEKIGFPKERRPFAGHITLGRKRHVYPAVWWRQIASQLQRFQAPQFDKFRIDEVVLMESHLSSVGSTYVPLAVQDLPR